MIVTSVAPCRISLFGGVTDTDPYALVRGGICINLAISLYQKMEVKDGLGGLSYYPLQADRNFILTILKSFGISETQLRVNSEFDGYMGAGIGSSAAAAVATIGAINEIQKLGLSRDQIAQRAWEIEVETMGWYGGKQDQFASVHGGFNIFTFEKGKVCREQVLPTLGENIAGYLVLFYTGGRRESREIQQGFMNLTKEKKESLDAIKELAFQAIKKIKEVDMAAFLDIFGASWELKKKSNAGITSPRIDFLYTEAQNVGIYGGKCLGAGGCGYMVFACPKDNQQKLIERMKILGCEYIQWSIDKEGLRTQII